MGDQIPHDFLDILISCYRDFGRHDMLWRLPEPDGNFDPYKILVSEIMLQQTQVARVVPKYAAFLDTFPTVQSLAVAPLGTVLQLWSGLGYNRRAKYLWQTAQAILREHHNVFPTDMSGLVALPGIGPNTAGAIMAYAYDQPVVYVETNVRTVIIHHFLHDQDAVTDAVIRAVLAPIVAGLVNEPDGLTPREFYWAMMDYGSHLKQTVGNLNRASTSYSRQSTFQGSWRQIRGTVIRLLAERPHESAELIARLDDDRADAVLKELGEEGLIHVVDDTYSLS